MSNLGLFLSASLSLRLLQEPLTASSSSSHLFLCLLLLLPPPPPPLSPSCSFSLLPHPYLVPLDSALQVLQWGTAVERAPDPCQQLLLHLCQFSVQLGHLCEEFLRLGVSRSGAVRSWGHKTLLKDQRRAPSMGVPPRIPTEMVRKGEVGSPAGCQPGDGMPSSVLQIRDTPITLVARPERILHAGLQAVLDCIQFLLQSLQLGAQPTKRSAQGRCSQGTHERQAGWGLSGPPTVPPSVASSTLTWRP